MDGVLPKSPRFTAVAVDHRTEPRSAAQVLQWNPANTVYGVFASSFLPTSNPVAANVITATARAVAYAIEQSLNGLRSAQTTSKRVEVTHRTNENCTS